MIMEKFEEMVNSEVPVLVDYFAVWCGPCKMMYPVLDELKQRMGERLKIVKIDVDIPANRQSVYTYQIQSVPTLMLFQKGKMLWRRSGVVGINQLQKVVEKYIGQVL